MQTKQTIQTQEIELRALQLYAKAVVSYPLLAAYFRDKEAILSRSLDRLKRSTFH